MGRKKRMEGESVQEQLARMGVTEVDTFKEWTSGDECGIDGEEGLFVFKSARVNEAGEVLWLNLVGGIWRGANPDKRVKEWRAIYPEKIKALRKGRGIKR